MEELKSLLNDFDLAALMPDLSTFLGKLELIVRIAVMVAPLALLGMGLLYFLAPPKEANYKLGYRCFWGMGSEEAWQFTQRLAGIVWSVLGLVLTVVMAIVSLRFHALEADAMTWLAVKCILWELGLVAVSILGINITLIALYDVKGVRRGTTPPPENTGENT